MDAEQQEIRDTVEALARDPVALGRAAILLIQLSRSGALSIPQEAGLGHFARGEAKSILGTLHAVERNA